MTTSDTQHKNNTQLAIIKSGGKQFKVIVGQHIWVDKISLPVQSTIVFDQVLMVDNHFGQPFLPNARVHGKVIKTNRAKKVVVFKYKPKKGYHKKQGHRQWQTKVLITAIALNGAQQVLSKPVPKKTDDNVTKPPISR